MVEEAVPIPQFVPPPQFAVEQDVPDPIGGFLAPAGPQNVLTSTGRQDSPFPGYFQGDEEPILRRLPLESLRRLQEELSVLGLLRGYIPGELDGATVSGFNALLSMSNTRRERWQTTLGRSLETVKLTGQSLTGGGGGGQMPDVYRPPNYAAAAEGIKSYFTDMLRRDPTDSELALLGDELASLHRQAFDSNVAAAQAAEDNVGAGRVIEGPAERDYQAEFRARMESKYAGEIEAVEDVDERQAATQTSNLVADSFGSLMGGA